MGARKQLTLEFKHEAVQLLESGSRFASELPASWGYGAINSINGSGSSRPETRVRFPPLARGRNARPRHPPEMQASTGYGGAGHFKKSRGVCRQGCAVSCGSMQTHQEEFRTTRMCAVRTSERLLCLAASPVPARRLTIGSSSGCASSISRRGLRMGLGRCGSCSLAKVWSAAALGWYGSG